jgi:hypothetical protein
MLSTRFSPATEGNAFDPLGAVEVAKMLFVPMDSGQASTCSDTLSTAGL